MNFTEFVKLLDIRYVIPPHLQDILDTIDAIERGDRAVVSYSRVHGRNYIYESMKRYWMNRLLKVLHLRLIKRHSGGLEDGT